MRFCAEGTQLKLDCNDDDEDAHLEDLPTEGAFVEDIFHRVQTERNLETHDHHALSFEGSELLLSLN